VKYKISLLIFISEAQPILGEARVVQVELNTKRNIFAFSKLNLSSSEPELAPTKLNTR
jgi:hypothetical protein